MKPLVMKGVWKAFQEGRWVLRGVDLEVDAGEAVLIVGPNGSGKTTLLRIAAGLLRPSRGSVTVCGHPPWSVEAKACRTVVLHWSLLYDELTVEENLQLYSRLYGVSGYSARSDTVVAALGLTSYLESAAASLSFGWRKRGDIARAMIPRPRLLLIDEPVTGLDEAAVEVLLRVLADAKKAGTAMVMTMPRLDDRLASIVDRVYELRDGRLVSLRGSG